jgi:two-component system, cell cycle response regulator
MSIKSGDTWVGSPKAVLTSGHLEACLVHIYPSGTTMGRRYPIQSTSLVLGRGDNCDIRLQDNSVSRNHAKIEPSKEGIFVVDSKSLNGTYVNDRPVRGAHMLQDGDYIRIGNAIFRFLTGGNIEAEYHEEIYRLTIMDGLTQIHNHRYLVDFLDREVARSVRHERPLAVVMFDIDRFKAVNDEHGHLCGDYVLREMSNRIRHSVRREDLFARYGGEEFALVLVETNPHQAHEVAERLRASIEEKPFWFESVIVPITVSVGVASVSNETDVTAGALLKEADEKLYEAKRTGRNRFVV